MSSSEIPATPAGSGETSPARTGPSSPAAARPDDGAEKEAVQQAAPTRPEARGRLALGLAALGLALIGQFYFINVRNDFRDGLLFYAAAITLFVILVRQAEAAGEGPSFAARARLVVERARTAPVKTVLIALSLALAYTTTRFLLAKPGYGSYWDVFAIWVVSIACYAAAFARPLHFDVRAWAQQYQREIALVAGLTIVAAAARLWALGAVPNIISGDEGRVGLLAEAVLRGEITSMMATIFGHSTMYLFLMAGLMKVFGVGTLSLRLTSALAGILTVPALYVLARRLFNVRVAVVAAALLTLSHIHVHFSRIVVSGSIQDAFFATLALYFLMTGLEERSAGRFVLSALVMGLHLYIYMGARLVILLVPVYLAFLWLTNRELVRQNAGNLLAFLGMLIVVSAPMALWAYLHTDEFMARANQVGIFQSGWLAAQSRATGQSQARILLEQLRQAFLTVNYFPAKGFYYSRLPMLDFASGAVFMLGIAYSLYHVFEPRHLLLQGWFWSGVVVGGALVVLPGDAAYRILIIFPAVCLFVALGWDRLVEFGGQALAASRARSAALTAVFVVAITVPNFKAYFLDYASTCRYEDWGTRFASRMGAYLGKLEPSYTPYLLGAPRIYYGIHPSVDFLSGRRPILDIDLNPAAPGQASFLDRQGNPVVFDPNGKAVFFVIPDREVQLGLVQSVRPGGAVEYLYDCADLQMIVYTVNGDSTP